MSLNLQPEIERQVRAYAQAEGSTVNEYVARLLEAQAALHNIKISSEFARTRQDRPSALGKYAHVAGGSEEFAREKQAEIAREDRTR